MFPEEVESLIRSIACFKNIKIQGLMTMGPFFEEPENLRSYFKLTKILYDNLTNAAITNVTMKYLSMGMSDSYQIAIEEGANVIRIGTKLFGKRKNI